MFGPVALWPGPPSHLPAAPCSLRLAAGHADDDENPRRDQERDRPGQRRRRPFVRVVRRGARGGPGGRRHVALGEYRRGDERQEQDETEQAAPHGWGQERSGRRHATFLRNSGCLHHGTFGGGGGGGGGGGAAGLSSFFFSPSPPFFFASAAFLSRRRSSMNCTRTPRMVPPMTPQLMSGPLRP